MARQAKRSHRIPGWRLALEFAVGELDDKTTSLSGLVQSLIDELRRRGVIDESWSTPTTDGANPSTPKNEQCQDEGLEF